MRKFLLKTSIFMVYVLLIQIAFPIIVDPFNVFHASQIRINGVELNKNYIKMKYILENPDKFDSFMFGSSRVGVIRTETITGEKCYNMTYASGLPGWHLLNIKTLLKNGICPQKIYIGIDPVAHTETYKTQINDPMRCPYEFLENDVAHFIHLYIDPAMTLRSFGAMLDLLQGKRKMTSTDIFYKYGWGIPIDKFDWTKVLPFDFDKSKKLKISSSKNQKDINTALGFFREITDICNENGIKLILFTNPLYYAKYLESVFEKDHLRFLEKLAEISDFWNFSSLNNITLNNANYHETSHYRAEVGDIIIDIICNGKSYPELQRQGFGVKVTRENAKDFIAMLKKQAEEYENKK